MSSANVIKDVFIPADKQQRDIILRIQREVADSPFMEIYQMHFIPETFVLYTTVLKFMEGIKRTLFRNDKNERNCREDRKYQLYYQAWSCRRRNSQ